MNCKSPAGFAFATFLLCAFPTFAQHGGRVHMGGGGRSGLGGSRSIGHSAGHSIGRIFGRRSARGRGAPAARAGGEAPPLAGAAMIRGRVVQLPNPQGLPVVRRPGFRRRPLTEFGFPRHSFFFVFGADSFLGLCDRAFGFPRRIFFARDFDCFGGPFQLDPFFVAGFDPFLDTWNSGGPFGSADLGSPPAELGPPAEESADISSPVADAPALSPSRPSPQPDTLLQLTNGSMYALTSYWLDGDRIHYITSYGGENSVPISQIDFNKTLQLNAAQGVKFELRPKPAAVRQGNPLQGPCVATCSSPT